MFDGQCGSKTLLKLILCLVCSEPVRTLNKPNQQTNRPVRTSQQRHGGKGSTMTKEQISHQTLGAERQQCLVDRELLLFNSEIKLLYEDICLHQNKLNVGHYCQIESPQCGQETEQEGEN